MAQDIEDATVRLIKTGEEIAGDFPEIKDEMLSSCRDTRRSGKFVAEQYHKMLTATWRKYQAFWDYAENFLELCRNLSWLCIRLCKK